MVGRDLAREVTPAAQTTSRPGGGDGRGSSRIDTGIKRSIVRNFARAARRSSCTRARRRAEELLAARPRRRLPRPTAPATRPRSTTSSTRSASWSAASRCSASASATSCSAAPSAWRRSSCPFGHRGANHPVKDLRTGRIEITSQNHGFAVSAGRRTLDADEPVRCETDFGAAELTHVNLYDRTVEGIRAARRARPAASSTTPRPGPGPHDSLVPVRPLHRPRSRRRDA